MADHTPLLQSIEQRAERAIYQELRLMTKEVLQLRPQLRYPERGYADALLLKLERLADEQTSAAPCRTHVPDMPAHALQADAPPAPDRTKAYRATFYGHGPRRAFPREMRMLASFEEAVQCVIEHLHVVSDYQVEAQWSGEHGRMQVLTLSGLPMASIEPAPDIPVVVHPTVRLACQALARGDDSGINDLFGQALMAA